MVQRRLQLGNCYCSINPIVILTSQDLSWFVVSFVSHFLTRLDAEEGREEGETLDEYF